MAKKTEDKKESLAERLKARLNKFQESRDTNSEEMDCKVSHYCSTRSIVIDKILGAGCADPAPLLPFGRMIELAGKSGSGKSTLLAQIAAEVQAQGGLVALADVEDRIDLAYWKTLGVNLDEFIPLKSRNLEDLFLEQYEFLDACIKENPDMPILLAWDSLGATRTKKLFNDTDSEDLKKNFMAVAERAMGKEAKVIAAGLTAVNTLVAKSKCCYVFTNQLYSKLNPDPWEDPLVSYGGAKVEYMTTVRLRLTKAGAITEEDDFQNKQAIGNRIKIQAIKNSLGPICLTKKAVILSDGGFNNDFSVFEVSKSGGPVSVKGAWSTWTTESGEEVSFQGWKGFQEKVMKHSSYKELVEYTKKSL